MKIHIRHHSDGMALVLAMIAVFVFSALAAGLALSMKVEARLAQNADSEQQLYWLGRSGVELARWVLVQQSAIQSEPYDAMNQVWAGGPGGAGTSNSVLCGLSLDNYPVGDGTVSVQIIDLDRKININSAPRTVIQQTLTVMGVDANDISVVTDSILDWIDPGDDALPAGAESDYYQGMAMPYYAKNAPIDNLSELLLVRGIWDHPEIYWGGVASNHPPSAFQHKLGLGNAPGRPPDYPFGLKDIFTPVSSGRVNINTADANVLQVIAGMDAAIAENIIKQRAGPDGMEGTEDDLPYRNISQLAGLVPNQQYVSQLNSICGVRSAVFEIHVQARLGDQHREYVAILWRNSGTDIRVVSFSWE
jgi:type II secretory pathway component PulK